MEIPPLPPSNQRVNRTQVSEKDPHHEREKKQHHGHEEIEDEIVLGDSESGKKENAPKPETPLSGHIDIEA